MKIQVTRYLEGLYYQWKIILEYLFHEIGKVQCCEVHRSSKSSNYLSQLLWIAFIGTKCTQNLCTNNKWSTTFENIKKIFVLQNVNHVTFTLWWNIEKEAWYVKSYSKMNSFFTLVNNSIIFVKIKCQIWWTLSFLHAWPFLKNIICAQHRNREKRIFFILATK